MLRFGKENQATFNIIFDGEALPAYQETLWPAPCMPPETRLATLASRRRARSVVRDWSVLRLSGDHRRNSQPTGMPGDGKR